MEEKRGIFNYSNYYSSLDSQDTRVVGFKSRGLGWNSNKKTPIICIGVNEQIILDRDA